MPVIRFLCGITAALLLPVAAASAQSLSFTVEGDVGPALTAKVAEYGLPRQVGVPAGKTLLEAVVALCGNNPTYLTLVGSERLKAVADVPRVETVPACIQPAAPDVAVVEPGDTLTKLLARNGFKGAESLDHWPSSQDQALATACVRSGFAGTCFPADAMADSAQVPENFKVNWLTADRPLEGQLSNIAEVALATAKPALESPAETTGAAPGAGQTTGAAPAPSPDASPIAAEEAKRIAEQALKQALLLAAAHKELARLGDRSLVAASVGDPDRIAPGMQVTVPLQRASYSTVFLRDLPNKLDAIADLQRVASLESEDRTTLQAEPTDALLVSPADEGCEGVPADYRPFDGAELVSQIGLNRRLRPSIPSERRAVLVLDTGLDQEIVDRGSPFPSAYFKRIQRPSGVAGAPRALGVDGLFGFNFALWSDAVNSPESFADRWHGLEVAGAVLGGSELEDYRYALDLPFEVAVGSLIAYHGGEPRIDPNALSSAIDHARGDREISIVNASFMAGRKIAGLENAALLADNVLLVVAAGNEKRNLDDWAVWPARYGGDPKNSTGLTAVTVGGHRPDGAIWPRSARSATYVDLLAPACRVPTYTGTSRAGADGKPSLAAIRKADNGTSLAAPIVSMVASILSSYGLKPWEIKQRLVFSSDFDPDLADVAFSSGRLNVRRAIAAPLDVVVVRDADDRFLRATFLDHGAVDLCGKSYAPEKLGKITVYETPAGKRVRYWLRSSNPGTPHLFEAEECALADTAATSIELEEEDGTRLLVPIADLVDFTPAMTR